MRDGTLKTLSLRTNCSAASRISTSVAEGGVIASIARHGPGYDRAAP
jgi:hypothetical protein